MELLVVARARAGYEVGDVIDVRPNGYAWGVKEILTPMFSIVRISNLGFATRRQALNTLGAELVSDELIPDPDWDFDPRDPTAPPRQLVERRLRRKRFRVLGNRLVRKVHIALTDEVVDQEDRADMVSVNVPRAILRNRLDAEDQARFDKIVEERAAKRGV